MPSPPIVSRILCFSGMGFGGLNFDSGLGCFYRVHSLLRDGRFSLIVSVRNLFGDTILTTVDNYSGHVNCYRVHRNDNLIDGTVNKARDGSRIVRHCLSITHCLNTGISSLSSIRFPVPSLDARATSIRRGLRRTN